MGDQPSFLWIVTDQERYDMVGANGSPICQTPQIDRLAQQGMRFTGAFTPIGICTPARASLLTGLYPHAHGMWNNCHGPDALQRELPADRLTFTELLKAAGYRLGYVGKWHVGYRLGPESRGFQDVVSEVYDVAAAAWVPAARARGFLTIQPGRPGVDRGPADVLLWEGRPGRGERLPWGELTPPARPFWLAGGLTPDNVAEALRTLGPDGVDVSSGVEDRPGQKDLRQVRRFIEEVRRWTRAST